ncbi:MAG TPA: hypothetical protein VK735_32545 [Pseudonocardia sp.]|uniref:hypothetical protein n=1 Tax=Pseudonocardia sp. TaxID=60912 RepID=UPI002C065AD7|nr:hypothetical protein [Pseudonocardia sp.]HTF52198.1 hypothetical protein [Pseudonocardia sp.]
MTTLVLLLLAAAFVLSGAALLRQRKNWLIIAEAERENADTWHTIGDHHRAAEREALAEHYERRAWPYSPAPKHGEQL